MMWNIVVTNIKGYLVQACFKSLKFYECEYFAQIIHRWDRWKIWNKISNEDRESESGICQSNNENDI